MVIKEGTPAMKTVLIVDDAAFVRASIKLLLKQHDYKVIGEAETGLEAVDLYQKFKPDIVTMDITMPELDGIDAIRYIIDLDPNAVIVIISAMGQEELVREAILVGAKDFIVKPFTDETVIKTLAKL